MSSPPEPASFDVAGPPDGDPIVFVHGTRLSRTSWSAQLTGLGDRYRVIAMDLPGHGVLSHRPFTLRAAADELERVIVDAAGGRAANGALRRG